jgi:type VI secretion system ImpM family protein
MKPVPCDAGYFGKLPSHGDYVRSGQARPEVLDVLEWLEAGLARLLGRGAAQDWSAWSADERQLFVYSPRAPSLRAPSPRILGLWAPSSDRVGRRYPFCAWESVEAAELELSAMPSIAARWEQLARQVFAGERQSESRENALRQIGAESWTKEVPKEGPQRFDELESLSVAQLSSEVRGAEDPLRLYELILDLALALAGSSTPRFVLEIPTQTTPLALAFWIRLVESWAPASARPLLVSWKSGASAAKRVSFVFDELAARYAEALLDPGRDSDAAYRLQLRSDCDSARARRAALLVGKCFEQAGSPAALCASLKELRAELLTERW